MEKHIETMKKTIDLITTIKDGLNYIDSRIKIGDVNNTIPISEDIVLSFATIEKTIRPLSIYIDNTEKLKNCMYDIQKSLDLLVSYYERENYYKIAQVVSEDLRIEFELLQKILNDNFQTYFTN